PLGCPGTPPMSMSGTWPIGTRSADPGALACRCGTGSEHDISPTWPPHAPSPAARRMARVRCFIGRLSYPHQPQRRERQDLRRADEIVDSAPFVGLMRDLELARAVRDAVGHAGNPRDVFVIVGPRARHGLRRP